MKKWLVLPLLACTLTLNSAFAFMMSGVEVNKSYIFILYKDFANSPNLPADVVCDIKVDLTNDVNGIKKGNRKATCADIAFKDVAAMVSPVKTPNKDIANLFNELAKSKHKWQEETSNDTETIYCKLWINISDDKDPLKNLCAYADRELDERSDSSVKKK